MANSCRSVLPNSASDLFFIPARTCGPLGKNDHGDPNVTSLLGDTPGSLGKNDHADPTMNLVFQTFEETAGTIVQTADGISVSVGMAADSVKEWAVKTDKEAAYQFFAAFFDHYLPKKFLNHYVYKKGDALTLTQQEMIDCNPAISLERSRDFNKLLQELSRAHAKCLIEPDIRPIDIRLIAAALTNGTLGQFTVKMKGNLEYRSASDWKVTGTMSFYDEWDFDVKDFKTGGRSVQGELKTRFAHYTLPGDGFKINSPEVPFTQTSSDTSVNWAGGTPQPSYDRVSQVDVAIKGLD